MVDIADRNRSRGALTLRLSVASETKVRIPDREHFGIDRAMRAVADGATLAQGGVLKNHRFGLFAVTRGTGLIQASRRQTARRFHDVAAMRVVALDTVHLAFNDRMVLWKMEFRLFGQMALETGFQIFAWINDELLAPVAPRGSVFAARAVTGFATVLAGHSGAFHVQTRMRAGRKDAGDIGMAVGASLVPDKCCALDMQRHSRSVVQRGTGIEEKQQRASTCRQQQSSLVGQELHIRVFNFLGVRQPLNAIKSPTIRDDGVTDMNRVGVGHVGARQPINEV